MASMKVEKIIEEIKKLTPGEQREIVRVLQKKKPSDKKHKISEIEGLGAEIWSEIDVDKYIEDERSSWD